MEVIRLTWLDRPLGALGYDTRQQLGYFEYAPSFIKTGLQVAPVHIPLNKRVYSFPALDKQTFQGLPGLLADSIPDAFTRAVCRARMARQGLAVTDINPLQYLQCAGNHGMGALGFAPATHGKSANQTQEITAEALAQAARRLLDNRAGLAGEMDLSGSEYPDTLLELLRLNPAADGARIRALVAFNVDFTQARSGLRAIPVEIYEAAALDNAGRWTTFRRITWPLLWPVTSLVFTIQLIAQLKIFDQVYLFSQGGRPNDNMVLVYYVFQRAFQQDQGGRAAAVAVTLFVLVVVVSVLQFQLLRLAGGRK